MTGPGGRSEATGKWAQLSLLSLATLLALSLWFSASAVATDLAAEWGLSGGLQAWMTMSVQIGFVAGALVSGALNLADRIRPPILISASAVFGSACTAAIAWLAAGPELALPLRFLTGVAMAGVYPPGMKLVASWCRADRGLCIGILVGALTIGSAAPHLLAVVPAWAQASAGPGWRAVLWTAAALAAAGGVLTLAFVREGPYRAPLARFDWRQAAAGLRDRPTRLANFGYLGHMWELYAVWTWVPLLLLESYRGAGLGEAPARLAGFAVVAIGAVGCVAAGSLADRWGRTRVTAVSLVVSGACALAAGWLAAHPLLLTALCLAWGLAVVADSAQFSAAVSELADPAYVGTALTVQTSLGFLLTLFTIRIVPPLESAYGWPLALAILALGPVFGAWSMLRLRALPEARRLASGRG